MASKTEARRAALRETLIDLADAQIAAEGVGTLRARDLAKEAGCAVGAIYNVFGDMGELVMAVNARTFDRLGAHIAQALQDAPDDPQVRLIVMAQAYHAFAAADRNRWKSLFDMERPAGESAPDWYLREMGKLFNFISVPLATLFPEEDEAGLALLTRGLFSSVHGIVLLGVEEASAGVPAGEVDRMIETILQRLLPQ